MAAKLVSGGTYVRFSHLLKDDGYGDVFKKVYSWIAESEFEPAHPFDIQVYDERFNGPDDLESILEILVLIKEK